MDVLRRIAAATLLASLLGCADPVSPPPVAPTPTPLTSTQTVHQISGTVVERVGASVQPLVNQYVSLVVEERQSLPRGWLRRQSARGVWTDDNGRYTADVPTSVVYAAAVWGPRQPCVASAVVDKNTTLNVEVFAGSSPQPSGTSPLVTGFVYETTPTGRQPIKGAIVFLDVGSDLFVASTETDDAGRFYFCRVDADLQLGVSAVGLQPNAQFASLSGGTDRHLEFEFRR